MEDSTGEILFLAKTYSEIKHVNVNIDNGITIADLIHTIFYILGFKGDLVFYDSKSDKSRRKLMDSGCLINPGWGPLIPLHEILSGFYINMKESFCQL